MEITTLKDLKEGLKDIPDEILEKFGAGIDPEGDAGDTICLLAWDIDEDKFVEFCNTNFKKYPILEKISDWIENIAREQLKVDGDNEEPFEREEPISSKK